MSRYRTDWNLTVLCQTEADFQDAVAKLNADKMFRFAAYGEEWTIDADPATLMARASLAQYVDNLDAAG